MRQTLILFIFKGFNHVVLFSRPVYFCLLTSGVLILDRISNYDFQCVAVYTIPLCSPGSVAYVKGIMQGKPDFIGRWGVASNCSFRLKFVVWTQKVKSS
jgi:hypothetical protein